jgi:ABC-type transporter Mla MlaB component
VVVRLRGPLSRDDCLRVCEQVRALLSVGSRRTVLCDVDVAADMRVVDVLVRLQLTATRARSRLHLREASEDVHRLLGLTGLAAVLCDLEPVGQSEAGEQGGVEEVVDVADLAR